MIINNKKNKNSIIILDKIANIISLTDNYSKKPDNVKLMLNNTTGLIINNFSITNNIVRSIELSGFTIKISSTSNFINLNLSEVS